MSSPCIAQSICEKQTDFRVAPVWSHSVDGWLFESSAAEYETTPGEEWARFGSVPGTPALEQCGLLPDRNHFHGPDMDHVATNYIDYIVVYCE